MLDRRLKRESEVLSTVRKDLDVAAAGEWFARMLFSLFSTPSSTLNMDDDEVVARLLQGLSVHRTKLSAVASDHLPLVGKIALRLAAASPEAVEEPPRRRAAG